MHSEYLVCYKHFIIFCVNFKPIFPLDFDGDDMLGISDLKQVIERLVGNQNHLSDNEMKQLIQSVLNEADLDDDGALSFPEFEHIIDKSSDFIK